MAESIRQFYTPDQYLALEDAADYKHEYYNGEIFAMAGGSIDHARIVRNFSLALDLALRDQACEAFTTEIKIQSAPKDFYTYPDIVIVCGEINYAEGRDDTLTNPTAIIEVLSASTRHYDRGDKFTLYKRFETLQAYVLVDQKRVNIEVFQRQPDGQWAAQIYQGLDEILKLAAINFETTVSSIYRKVDFKQKPRHPRIKKQKAALNSKGGQDGPTS